jgi:hypothetical protein
MAKSKTKVKTKTKHVDEEEQVKARAKPADEEPADLDVEDADAAEAEAEVDAEAEAEPEETRADSVDKEPIAPPARITKTTIALIVLNWIAAPTFLFFAYMDYMVRVQYSYRTMLNYVQVWGLPLKTEQDDEKDFTPFAMDTRPRLNLTSDQLSSAFKKRPGVAPSATPFKPVDEPVPLRLRPSDLTTQMLTDVFQGISDPVTTLDDEIIRLTSKLPGDIEGALKDDAFAKLKTDEEKRTLIHKVLMPIAGDVWRVEKLDDKVAKTKGKELDDLVADAVQRRIYYDILAPINVHRPGDLDIKNYKIERLANWDTIKLDEVKELMKQRLAASVAVQHDLDVHLGKEVWDKEQTSPEARNRSSVEKRQAIGFILFTLSQVALPTLPDKKLYPKGIERAQVVSGLYEFTSASIHYVSAMRVLEERIVGSIKADREGWVTELKDKPGQFTRTDGAIDQYESGIDRLVKMVDHIDGAKKRLADLESQRVDAQKIHDQRVQQHRGTLDKLLKARAKTQGYAQELRLLQDQLHKALVELSDAGDRNYQLYVQIRDIEYKLLAEEKKNKKGGKR